MSLIKLLRVEKVGKSYKIIFECGKITLQKTKATGVINFLLYLPPIFKLNTHEF